MYIIRDPSDISGQSHLGIGHIILQRISDRIMPEGGLTYSELLRLNVNRGLYVEANGQEEFFIHERIKRHNNPEGSIIRSWNDGSWHIIQESKTAEGGIALIYSDITELKRTEYELTEARGIAEMANKAKSEFLGNMSHELRTPLNAIIGFSAVLAGEYYGKISNPTYKEYAADIQRSGEHLLMVLSDLLDISKIESGEILVEAKELDTAQEITDCVKMVEAPHNNRNSLISVKLPDKIPNLYADPRHIPQIMLNLLSNALKFTPDNGTIVIEVSAKNPNFISISVTDSGIGIAPEDIEKIVKPFGQVADSMTRDHEGVGLGLSIVNSLTELHGGELQITSKMNVGTTVEILIPYKSLMEHKVTSQL